MTTILASLLGTKAKGAFHSAPDRLRLAVIAFGAFSRGVATRRQNGLRRPWNASDGGSRLMRAFVICLLLSAVAAVRRLGLMIVAGLSPIIPTNKM